MYAVDNQKKTSACFSRFVHPVVLEPKSR